MRIFEYPVLVKVLRKSISEVVSSGSADISVRGKPQSRSFSSEKSSAFWNIFTSCSISS